VTRLRRLEPQPVMTTSGPFGVDLREAKLDPRSCIDDQQRFRLPSRRGDDRSWEGLVSRVDRRRARILGGIVGHVLGVPDSVPDAVSGRLGNARSARVTVPGAVGVGVAVPVSAGVGVAVAVRHSQVAGQRQLARVPGRRQLARRRAGSVLLLGLAVSGRAVPRAAPGRRRARSFPGGRRRVAGLRRRRGRNRRYWLVRRLVRRGRRSRRDRVRGLRRRGCMKACPGNRRDES
jgi:hypothetical protein